MAGGKVVHGSFGVADPTPEQVARQVEIDRAVEEAERLEALAYKPGRVGLNVIRLQGLLAEAEEWAFVEMTGDPGVEEAMEDFEREILTFAEMKLVVLEAMPRAYVGGVGW